MRIKETDMKGLRDTLRERTEGARMREKWSDGALRDTSIDDSGLPADDSSTFTLVFGGTFREIKFESLDISLIVLKC